MEVLEPLTAERGLVELQRLDHRAHGAVENQDALTGSREKGGTRGRDGSGHQAAALLADFGRMPSRWLIAKTRSARFMV